MAEEKGVAEVQGSHLDNKRSLFTHIEHGLVTNPDGPAVIAMHQPASHLQELIADHPSHHANDDAKAGCLSWTFAQLHHAALRLAAGLMANGVHPGSTLVTLMPNRVEYSLVLWTSIVMRCSLAALDFGALTAPRHAELQNYMHILTPDAIIVPDAEGAEAVDAALKNSERKPAILVQLDGGASGDWKTLLDVAQDGRHHHPFDEAALVHQARNDDPNRVQLILFTSGTSSGQPKGCSRHAGSLTHWLQTSEDWPKYASFRWPFDLANFRVSGPTYSLHAWKKGGAVVIPGATFSPASTLDAIEQHRVTWMVMTPAILHALTSDSSFNSRDVSSMRQAALGGDMITRDLLLKTKAAFPQAIVWLGHGMTEGGWLFCNIINMPIERLPCFGDIAPVGHVAAGARVRIWQHDEGRVSKRGEPGELHVCSGATIKHYLHHANEDSFYEDKTGRWFNTGDLGMIDESGVVFILGRSKDVIKRAGIPITPAALESCIHTFTGSATSVIAVPSTSLGQEPFAVVARLNGRTVREIQEHVLALFGKDYALAGVATLDQIGLKQFPLNATGKIMKIHVQKSVLDYLHK